MANAEEATSLAMREKVWDWFLSTALTRLSEQGMCGNVREWCAAAVGDDGVAAHDVVQGGPQFRAGLGFRRGEVAGRWFGQGEHAGQHLDGRCCRKPASLSGQRPFHEHNDVGRKREAPGKHPPPVPITRGGRASAAAQVGFHGATPTAQRAEAAQAAVTYASQTISDPPTQAQVQAVNDGLVAAINLVNELRAAAVEKGMVKGA